MTKSEIIETAMRGIGKRNDGEGYDPIMPYLLGDVMYQIYVNDVSHLKLSHKMKQMSGRWIQRYTHFNKPIFSAFPTTDYDELTDMMDSVNETLSNEIMMLRSGVMQTLSGVEDFERKKAITSMLLCHMFAQYAESSYRLSYFDIREIINGRVRFVKTISLSNPDLCFLRDLSYKMAIQYIKETPGGELQLEAVDLQPIFNLIAKKIYNWLKEN